jgi:hypothetical protein
VNGLALTLLFEKSCCREVVFLFAHISQKGEDSKASKFKSVCDYIPFMDMRMITQLDDDDHHLFATNIESLILSCFR